MTRTLSDKDIREMETEKDHTVDNRKTDRRRAISTCMDPKEDRRTFDRRKNK